MKHMLLLFILLVAGQPYLLQAQEISKIEGNVVDENNISLPNVSLRIGHQTGTMTNNEGDFILKYNEEHKADTLQVSFIGYKGLKILLKDIKNPLKIRLEPQVFGLNEVVISSVSAQSIVVNAIHNIPKNYPVERFEMIGFYRETGRIDSSYLSFSEAVLNILDEGYQKRGVKDQIVVKRERNLKKVGDREVNNPFNSSIKGIPYAVLENDLIKNPGAILGKDYLSKYDYKITGSTSINGSYAWVISFDQKDGVKEALYKGKLVILDSSYVIVSIDFTMSPKGKQYAESDIPMLQRPILRWLGYTFQKLDEELTERYTEFNGKWYPSFIKIATTHHVKAKKEKIDGNLYISAELFISGINKIPQSSYNKSSIMPTNYNFQKAVKNYNDDYWGDYNFIKPTTSLKELSRKLNAP